MICYNMLATSPLGPAVLPMCYALACIMHGRKQLEHEGVRYERNPEFVLRKVVDEFVLVPVRQDAVGMDCIYTLDALGAFIWDRLDGHATLANIQASIVAEYEVSPQVVAADLLEFVQALQSAGALRRV
jgi:hypothetical protein